MKYFCILKTNLKLNIEALCYDSKHYDVIKDQLCNMILSYCSLIL